MIEGYCMVNIFGIINVLQTVNSSSFLFPHKTRREEKVPKQILNQFYSSKNNPQMYLYGCHPVRISCWIVITPSYTMTLYKRSWPNKINV